MYKALIFLPAFIEKVFVLYLWFTAETLKHHGQNFETTL